MKILDNYDKTKHINMVKELIKLSDEMVVASPFMADDIDRLLDELGIAKTIKKLTILTVLKAFDEGLRKADILWKFIGFCEQNSIHYEILIDEKLHGKVYLFYKNGIDRGVVVTSANITQSGLINNHEWGFGLQDSEKQKYIHDTILSYKGNMQLSKPQVKNLKEAADKFKIKYPQEKETHKFDAAKALNLKPAKKSEMVKYFIKPIGSADHPYNNKKVMPIDIHFSKAYPKAVTENDILICYAVGNGRLLGYYRVTSEKAMTDPNPYDERWPHYVESECLSQLYSDHWWDYDLYLKTLEKQFTEQYPDIALTKRGGNTLGALQWGRDKIQLTEEFARYLLDEIDAMSTTE